VTKEEHIVREAWEKVAQVGPKILCIYGEQSLFLWAADTWHSAAKYTIRHQKKIDDVKEEITDLKATVLMAASTGQTKRETINRRILAARQVVLVDLQRGWKGTK